jgi:hypothetical protein
MKKKCFIALKIYNNNMMVDGVEATVKLPEGCHGTLLAFDSLENLQAWEEDDNCDYIKAEFVNKVGDENNGNTKEV